MYVSMWFCQNSIVDSLIGPPCFDSETFLPSIQAIAASFTVGILAGATYSLFLTEVRRSSSAALASFSRSKDSRCLAPLLSRNIIWYLPDGSLRMGLPRCFRWFIFAFLLSFYSFRDNPVPVDE